MPKRRSFQRPQGERRYKKLFIIAVEGVKTEPQYFNIDAFKTLNAVIGIKCLKRKNTNSAPLQVLRRMKEYLQKVELRKRDEAWLVVDKDQWPEEQLRELMDWEKKKDNYGFALSNPSFEYWLLLHFEDGKGSNAQECLKRLKEHIPNYEKEINRKQITKEHVRSAIQRAKQKKINNADLFYMFGSTVYKLVEKILNEISM